MAMPSTPIPTALQPLGRKPGLVLLTSTLALALTGCATPVAGPDLQTATQPRDAAWTWRAAPALPEPSALPGTSLQPALSTQAVPGTWWSLFDDPLLSALQTQATDGNLDLQAALLRIAESQARLGMTEATGLPRVNFDAGYSRAALSADSPLARLGMPTRPYDQYQWGGQASWEIDLWGHHQQLTESARSQLEATHWAASAARVSLSAEVARQYLLLRGVQAQQRLVDEHRQIAAELLRLTESRERNGVATRFDSAAARAEQATVEARAIQLGQQRDVLMNALALLLGQPPHALDERLLAGAMLPPMPRELPVGVPSDLVRQRPDILQAEAQLRAATADKGAAKADFYPRVSLNAGWSISTARSSELGNWDMRQFSVGPVVHLPLFDGGLLQRTLALTDARQRSVALAWRSTVLRAWHEVGAALDASLSEQAKQARQQEAVAHSSQALDNARNAWKAGSAEFTTVLVAQRSLLNAQSALTDTTTAAGLTVVSLYRALGGGLADVKPTRQVAEVRP
ncbi:MAG: hypothetical protein RLY78_3329 [Pseudomonadota bacterium]